MSINYQKLDEKIWALLGTWKDIEPKPGYIGRFNARIAERKPWFERFSLSMPVLKPILVMCFIFIAFGSAQTYSTYTNTKQLLSSIPQQEWDMLANYETIANLNVVDDKSAILDIQE